MPHLHRFFHPADPPPSGEVALSRDECHHALRVLRVRPGQAVELFNGRGYAWSGTIAERGRNEVRVAIDAEQFTPEPEPRVSLAQAWLHRDKLHDDLVRQATVLGAARLCFFRAEHSEKAPRVSKKWERLAIEACKQCGRRWLPAVTVADSLVDVLDATRDDIRAIATMQGPHLPLSALDRDRPIAFIVGPEGDFSDAEYTRARGAGALPLSLGSYTLRSEMAAITGLTLIQHHLGHLG